MSLFKTFQNRQQSAAAVTPVPQQEQLQQTLQTKATGKAVQPTAAPKASAVQEAQVFQTAQTQQRQIEQQGRIQQAQLKEQATQVQEKGEAQQEAIRDQAALKQLGISTNEAIAMSKIRNQEDLTKMQQQASEHMQLATMTHQANQHFYKIAQEKQININNLVHDLKASRQQLDADKQLAEYEQRTFIASMRSKEYVQRIKQIGNLNRMQDASSFREEAVRIQMGHRAAMLQRDLDEKKQLRAENRQFNYDQAVAAANMEIQIAMEQLGDDLKKMKFEAGSQAVQAAGMATLQAYQKGFFTQADVGETTPNLVSRHPYISETERSLTPDFNQQSTYYPYVMTGKQ